MAEAIPQDPPPSNNRGLWMLVIGLGIAIIVVLALMIGMAIRQAVYGKPSETTAATPSTSATLKPGDVPELNLDLAPGMNVAETRMDGTHLIVRLTGPNAEEILVIDATKQRVLSRIRFNKKTP